MKLNGNELLDGTNAIFNIQAGANTEVRNIGMTNLASIAADISNMDVSDISNAQSFVETMDNALAAINKSRADLGAMQNRLEYTSSNLTTSTENLTAAESRIRDVDIASEMMNLSKLNLLTQASQAMMSQAKSQPENVMQLLR